MKKLISILLCMLIIVTTSLHAGSGVFLAPPAGTAIYREFSMVKYGRDYDGVYIELYGRRIYIGTKEDGKFDRFPIFQIIREFKKWQEEHNIPQAIDIQRQWNGDLICFINQSNGSNLSVSVVCS